MSQLNCLKSVMRVKIGTKDTLHTEEQSQGDHRFLVGKQCKQEDSGATSFNVLKVKKKQKKNQNQKLN